MNFRTIAIVLALAIALAGCGSADSSPSGGPSAAAGAGAESEPLSSSTVTLAPGTATLAPGTATEVPAIASTTTPATATPPGAPVTTAPASEPATALVAPPPTPAASGKPCIVSLHGKGGGGQREWTGSDGVRHSFPAGNEDAWGGRHWLYYPESNYQTTRNIVANDVAAGGCGRVIVYGFSNGAAFAAKLYCRGETFGTIVGYVIDDPVVDHAVEGCARPPVKVVLYWTGDIDQADGWPCGDWTCEGGSTIGIARYQAAIGVGRTPSIHSTHRQYVDPPEFHSWF